MLKKLVNDGAASMTARRKPEVNVFSDYEPLVRHDPVQSWRHQPRDAEISSRLFASMVKQTGPDSIV